MKKVVEIEECQKRIKSIEEVREGNGRGVMGYVDKRLCPYTNTSAFFKLIVEKVKGINNYATFESSIVF